jgi:hypothetical protein
MCLCPGRCRTLRDYGFFSASATGCGGALVGEIRAEFPDEYQSQVQGQLEVNGAEHQYADGFFGCHGILLLVSVLILFIAKSAPGIFLNISYVFSVCCNE